MSNIREQHNKTMPKDMSACYHSTRDRAITATPKEAILSGLAKDGGLYVNDQIQQIRLPLEEMMHMCYEQMAEQILSVLLPDFETEEIRECVKQAYEGYFDNNEVTPLVQSGNDLILELFHGPTCAFKDVALRMLPQLMSKALTTHPDESIMIVTATSGDTGKAALAGFYDAKNIGITVFYPDQGVSEIQRLQMVTQVGKHVAVAAIQGNFDDAQSHVKALFHDCELQHRLQANHIRLSSANSINIGRFIPQIVYYFYAYQQLVARKIIRFSDTIDFCVPSGNFGNVLAGYYAKQMGLPIRHLIVACNENHVLHDFLTTGIYDRNRSFHKTISPSMDILISSNLERLLYEASGKDTAYVSELMKDLKETGHYEVNEAVRNVIQSTFISGYVDDATCKNVIKEKYERDHYLLDPHTACGYQVMRRYQDDHHPCVLLATASPYKFAHSVYDALFSEMQGDAFAMMDALEQRTGIKAPFPLRELRQKALLHEDVIACADMSEYVWKQARGMRS